MRKFLLFINTILLGVSTLSAQTVSNQALSTKELYLPDTIWRVPEGNDFNESSSEYNIHHMAETANLTAFWSKKFGNNPLNNPDSTLRFDISDALKECERFYDFYVNELKFVEKGNSVTDQYKSLLFIFAEEDHTAYGGGEEDKIGMLWTSPVRMSKAPYGALAHELGHSFQYLVHADGNWGFTSTPEGSFGHSLFEMTSQYMLWQVYPEWMTFENYHLVDFMKQTHLAFLHEKNMYHSPYVLEYWSGLHGIDFIGRIWKEAKEGEDAVLTYQRLQSISQKQFNDQIFDAYRHFVTWDMERIEEVASPYKNQHFTELDSLTDGWYQITQDKCPQNYGYNAIQLNTPKGGAKIQLEFEGLSKTEGYRSIQPEKEGWRYGFVAVKENGDRVYGDIFSDKIGKVKLKVPKETKYLWLVVSGAPTKHWEHLVDGKEENDEQWPYKIKLSGTTIDAKMVD